VPVVAKPNTGADIQQQLDGTFRKVHLSGRDQ
jgi:hypothetical protein